MLLLQDSFKDFLFGRWSFIEIKPCYFLNKKKIQVIKQIWFPHAKITSYMLLVSFLFLGKLNETYVQLKVKEY